MAIMNATPLSSQSIEVFQGFNGPNDVAVDVSGNIYIANINNGQIAKLAANGTQISVFTTNPPLIAPNGIVVDVSGNIYIADTYNDRIVKLASNGIQLSEFTTTNPSLSSPTHVALDVSGNIYIADNGNARVVKLASNGTELSLFSTTNPTLNLPYGVAVDVSGNIYVTDYYNSRIVKLASNGTQLSVFVTANPSLSSPRGVAVDVSGNIYVADSSNNRIVKLASNGTEISVFNTTYPSLNYPTGVAVDASGNIYIADNDNNRVVVFISCQSGYYCPSTAAPPIQCPAGWFCPADYQSPISCLVGYYCPYVSSSPIACINGEYCPSNSAAPLACPAGYYCSSPSASLVACNNGTYCPSNSTFPMSCLAGYYCASSSSQSPCTAGYYCPVNSTSPLLCPAGSYCPYVSSSPIACINGEYCPSNSAAPLACPAGYYCPFSSGSPLQCNIGSYCPANSTSPSVCAVGSYCVNPSHTSFCPAGSYGVISGLSTANCSGLCDDGCSCPSGSIIPCPLPCPLGSYCRYGYQDGCPMGTYGNVSGLSNPSCSGTCTDGCLCPNNSVVSCPAACPSGYYCSNGNVAPCANGTYCPLSTISPLPCSSGSYCIDGVNSTCPTGHYCPLSSSNATQCPIGTFSSSTGQAECQQCPPGYTCLATGLSIAAPCPIDYYCPGVASVAVSCPSNTDQKAPAQSFCESTIVCLCTGWIPTIIVSILAFFALIFFLLITGNLYLAVIMFINLGDVISNVAYLTQSNFANTGFYYSIALFMGLSTIVSLLIVTVQNWHNLLPKFRGIVNTGLDIMQPNEFLKVIYIVIAYLVLIVFNTCWLSLWIGVGVIGILSRMLAINDVLDYWISMWNGKDRAGDVKKHINVALFHQLFLIRLLLEAIPQLIVQSWNNQRLDEWTSIAVLSTAFSALFIMINAYRYGYYKICLDATFDAIPMEMQGCSEFHDDNGIQKSPGAFAWCAAQLYRLHLRTHELISCKNSRQLEPPHKDASATYAIPRPITLEMLSSPPPYDNNAHVQL